MGTRGNGGNNHPEGAGGHTRAPTNGNKGPGRARRGEKRRGGDVIPIIGGDDGATNRIPKSTTITTTADKGITTRNGGITTRECGTSIRNQGTITTDGGTINKVGVISISRTKRVPLRQMLP